MKYTWYRICRLLWSHKNVYWLTILELAAGIGILVSGMNLLFTNQRILDSYREDMTMEKTVIYHNQAGGSMDPGAYADTMAVRYEDYLELWEMYGDQVEIYYGAIYYASANLFQGEDEQSTLLAMVFMNDAMFEDMFSFKRQDDRLYAGSRAAAVLQKAGHPDDYPVYCIGREESLDPEVFQSHETKLVFYDFKIENNKIVLSKDHALSWEPIPNEEQTPYIDRLSICEMMDPADGARLEIQDCIIGSTDMLAYVSEDYDPFDSILQIRYLTKNFDPKIAPDMANWLGRERGEDHYQFSISSKMYTMEGMAQDMGGVVMRYMAVAAVILAICLAGTVGRVQKLIFCRSASLKIAYCCGATRWQSFMELFGEVALSFWQEAFWDFWGSRGDPNASNHWRRGDRIHFLQSISDINASAYNRATRAVFYPELIVPAIAFCLAAALICCAIGAAGVHDTEEQV